MLMTRIREDFTRDDYLEFDCAGFNSRPCQTCIRTFVHHSQCLFVLCATSHNEDVGPTGKGECNIFADPALARRVRMKTTLPSGESADLAGEIQYPRHTRSYASMRGGEIFSKTFYHAVIKINLLNLTYIANYTELLCK